MKSDKNPQNPCHHEHKQCVATALATAEKLAAERKQRLTPLRRRVLELIWQSHKPVGAYDILSQLTAEEGCPAPPTVYRALDFLIEQGFVHRINALNAFLGCPQADHEHVGHMFICEQCKNATEVTDPSITKAIAASAAKQNFDVHKQWLEVVGVCSRCQ